MSPAKTWVVALEVGEDPDGPGLDAAAMAMRMEAVADIRPTSPGRGQRLHSFLLRLDGQDTTEAVVSAIGRFRAAAVGGGALVGARVLRSGEVGGAADVPGAGAVGAGRRSKLPAALRPKVLVAAAVVLLVGAALLAIGGRSQDSTTPSPTARQPVAQNLLSDPSFEMASKTKGLARGMTAWGDVHASLVDNPVHSGHWAQLLQVGAGQKGGAWFDVDAIAGRTYVQSAWIQVRALDPGASVELLIEWYGPAANLLGYQPVPVTATDPGFVLRQQTVTAPAGTTRARFLVNFTGGGMAVVDDAALRSPPT
ncbi:MAG: hypothetical protein JO176_01730 [Acidimicrobiia bacterium]|nr:hypothetical protein [Acidimicrobiia bacterium]